MRKKRHWFQTNIGKSLCIFILVGLVFLIATVVVYPPTAQLTDQVFLGAHRGDSKRYIENTLPAFESALQNETYHFIEFDIQYTKDKEIVVHHDLSLLRLQKKPQTIADLTYDELNAISSYHIPRYSEVMDLLAGQKPLNIEIKSQGNLTDDIRLADDVIADLEQRGIRERTVISSISFDLIQHINAVYNNLFGYEQYIDYWTKQQRYIDTGLIFYVDESTFTRRIPLVDVLSEQLRDSGLVVEPFTEKWWLSGANHIMLHGANVRQYHALRQDIPYNSRVVLWTFGNQMFLVLPDKMIWDSIQGDDVIPIDQVRPWWDDEL